MKKLKPFLFFTALLLVGGVSSSHAQTLYPIEGITATATDPSNVVEGSAQNLVDEPSLIAGPSGVVGASDSLGDDASTGNGGGYAITRGLLLFNPGSVTFNLGGAYSVSDLLVWNYSQTGFYDVGANSVTISTSTDGVTYLPLSNLTFAENTTYTTQGDYTVLPQTIPVSIPSTQYIELTFNSNYGYNGGGDEYTGINAISFVAAAAPEPSTYAMMFAGVVLLMGVSRIRKLA